MATTFFPVVSTMVKASKGYNISGNDYHPENTEYKVSIGYENNDGDENCLVRKVQICYDGKISGRRSPSFPFVNDDWNRVKHAMDQVEAFYASQNNKALRNCII